MARRSNRHEARDDRADIAHISPNKVQHALKGISYPASKQDLVGQAQKNRAPDIIMRVINGLPEREYGGPQEVMKESKPLI